MANFATKTQIRAEDLASPIMKRVAAQARLTARSFRRINAAADSMRRLGNLARPLERGVFGLGVATAAAGGAALAMANRYATATDETAKLARQTGFSAEELDRFRFIAERQGASYETITGGLETFTKRMGELRAGTGGLNALLKKTDPAFATLLKNTTSNEEAFRLFIERVSSLPDAQSKAALAAAGVSRGAAASIIRFGEGGEKAIAKLQNQADKFRAPLTEQDRANTEAYKDSQTNLQFALRGVSDTIGRNLLPALSPLNERLADWVALNRPLLDAKLDAYGDRVAASLDRIDFDRVAKTAERYARGAQHVIRRGDEIVESLGGIEKVIATVAKAWLILRGLSIASLVLRAGVQTVAFAQAIAGIGTATALARTAAVADFDAIGNRYSRLSAAIGRGIVFGGIAGIGGAIGISQLNKKIDERASELVAKGVAPERAKVQARSEVTGEANDKIAKGLVGLTDRLGFLKITDPRIRGAAGAEPLPPTVVVSPVVPPVISSGLLDTVRAAASTPALPASLPRVPSVAQVPRVQPVSRTPLPQSTPVPGIAARLRSGNSEVLRARPASTPLTPIRRLAPAKVQVQVIGDVRVEVDAAQGTRARVTDNRVRMIEPRRKPELGITMSEGN